MPNPYPSEFATEDNNPVRLDGLITFTDPGNQPGGGSGGVDSVTAGDASITIGGTAVDPTVEVSTQGVTTAKIANLAVTDAQVATANKDGTAGTESMRTLGTGAQQACAGNDSRLSDSRPPNGSAGGDLTGTYPNPTLAATAVTPATYGDATHVPQVTFDSKGRATAASNVAVTGTPPGGSAGGDLSGTYPNPTVAQLNGVAITNAPTASKVLTATDATHASWAAAASGGVSSLDSITGAVTLVAGSNVTITDNSPSSGDITIAASGSGSSPLTTKGDIFGHSTVDARIPVGSDGQVVTAASAQTLGVAYQYPPGYEIGYDQITSPVNVTSTTEASGNTVITCGAHTFDGGPVIASFFAPVIQAANSTVFTITVCLFESSTQITRLGFVGVFGVSAQADIGATFEYRFTPSAGSHTYTVTAFAGHATGAQVIAGSGGTGGYPPSFIRFIKV